MKAKLHKMVSGYILSLNGDIDDPYAIVNEELAKDHEWHKLSLKNCQAIEHGYDLDELAKDRFGNSSHHTNNRCSYKEGFQKALSILSDKKFSEKDMSKAWSEGYHRKVDELNGNGLRYFDKFIQSLQQTEWEVEIITENVCGRCYSNNTDECWSAKECSDGKYDYSKPLLDADGCLILKRI